VIRAWGAVRGFMATTAVAGPAIGFLREHAFVPLFVGFACPARCCGLADCRSSAGGVSRRLHFSRDRGGQAAPGDEVVHRRAGRRCAALCFAWRHRGCLGALLWTRQGVPEGLIGMLIAVMAASEAAMMFLGAAAEAEDFRAAYHHLCLLVAGAALDSALAFSPPIWLLFLLQGYPPMALQMGYLGGIYFIANWTKESIAAGSAGVFLCAAAGCLVG